MFTELFVAIALEAREVLLDDVEVASDFDVDFDAPAVGELSELVR